MAVAPIGVWQRIGGGGVRLPTCVASVCVRVFKMYNQGKKILERKDQFESCARDFLRLFTFEQFDQQFLTFLTGLRQMISSRRVNQANSNLDLQLNNQESRNSTEYRGSFNHGEFHSRPQNFAGQVENNENAKRIKLEPNNADLSSELNGTVLKQIYFFLILAL